MLRTLFVITLVLGVKTSSAQSNPELERRNGFKTIKLGTVVDSIQGIKFKNDFKEKDEFDAKLYSVENPDVAKIGEVNVDKVELKTYKSLIYQIHVVTERDTRLMKALESIYGLAKYDHKRETYFWKGQDLVLKFRPYNKNKLEMIYTSYAVLNMMKVDKGKKVEDIADDF